MRYTFAIFVLCAGSVVKAAPIEVEKQLQSRDAAESIEQKADAKMLQMIESHTQNEQDAKGADASPAISSADLLVLAKYINNLNRMESLRKRAAASESGTEGASHSTEVAVENAEEDASVSDLASDASSLKVLDRKSTASSQSTSAAVSRVSKTKKMRKKSKKVITTEIWGL